MFDHDHYHFGSANLFYPEEIFEIYIVHNSQNDYKNDLKHSSLMLIFNQHTKK